MARQETPTPATPRVPQADPLGRALAGLACHRDDQLAAWAAALLAGTSAGVGDAVPPAQREQQVAQGKKATT